MRMLISRDTYHTQAAPTTGGFFFRRSPVPRDGSGTATQPASTAAVSGAVISSSDYNSVNTDIYSLLTTSINTAGTKPMAADLILASDPTALLAAVTKQYVDRGQSITENTIASSGTTDVLGGTSVFSSVTGTTTITSLGTGANRYKIVRFTGALTLTHNATSLIIPGGANITTAAGDIMLIRSDASSNVRVVSYFPAAGIIPYATQTNMETGTSTATVVSPGQQKNHPGHPKAWGFVTVSGGNPTLVTSYGVSGITDTGVGILGVTLSPAMSSANYAVVAITQQVTPLIASVGTGQTTTDFTIRVVNTSSTLTDPSGYYFAVFGDQ